MIQILKLENNFNQENYFEILSMLKDEINSLSSEKEKGSDEAEPEIETEDKKKNIKEFFEEPKVRWQTMHKNVHLVNKAVQC